MNGSPDAPTEAAPLENPISPKQRSQHRLAFGSVFILTAGTGILLFADFLWRTDLYGLKYLLLVLHAALFSHISFGFCTALFGFLMRRRTPEHIMITERLDRSKPISPDAATAILFPIYNEDVTAVFGNLRATYEALEAAGVLDRYDFFVLSDTRDPNRWIAEEVAWQQLCRELNAFPRIHYRHRRNNENKKAGNISGFLRAWGARYRYMVIYDADSIMSADTLETMVAVMEQQPQVGLLQSAPGLFGGTTVYARLQQFASRLYSQIFLAGLNFWQLSEGNYWGHNAIIRVKPFIDHCDLPDLPGHEPIGGKILSHDFVEAALMRRAGYEVWLAPDLEGSFEEGPPQLSESLQRDRRWCQGNLQHSWLLFARDFTVTNRLHFFNGIMAYLGSMLWFAFLIVSTLVVINFARSGLTLVPVSGFTRELDNLSLPAHGAVILAFTGVVLYLPKILSIVDAVLAERAAKYGGFVRMSGSVLLETLASAFIAPILMVRHTTQILGIIFGARVGWGAQNRTGGGYSFPRAVAEYFPLSVLGIAWATIARFYDAIFFWWLVPVMLPLTLAPVTAYLLASAFLGARLREHRVLATPEETDPPEILRELPRHRAATSRKLARRPHAGHALVFADPFLNALHVALEYRQNEPTETTEEQIASLEKLLAEGPDALNEDSVRTLLASPALVDKGYHAVWSGPPENLAPFWRRLTRAFRS